MWRTTLAALAAVSLLAPPCAARSRTAGAVEAANAVKSEFHGRNAPGAARPAGLGRLANRSLRVVVSEVLADGTLALSSPQGEPRGVLDPLAVPEIVTRQRARFGGRRRLEPADLRPGQRIELLFHGSGPEILRIRVLKSRSG